MFNKEDMALARTGLNALIDEATGFQTKRSPTALIDEFEKMIGTASEFDFLEKNVTLDIIEKIFKVMGWSLNQQNIKIRAVDVNTFMKKSIEQLSPFIKSTSETVRTIDLILQCSDDVKDYKVKIKTFIKNSERLKTKKK